MSDVDTNAGLLYQTTCRRPTWPFEDWRYDVFTQNKRKNRGRHPDDEVGTWYTTDECKAIVEVLRAESQTENYPFRKQRLAGILKKTIDRPVDPKKNENRTVKGVDPRKVPQTKLSLAGPFFDILKKVFVPEYPEEICKLRTDLLEVLEDAAIYLRQTTSLFNNCDIVPVGSLADDSKRLNADEVDFLVLLPSLSKLVKHAQMCDETDLAPTLLLSLEDDQTFPIEQLATDLEKALTKCMKSGWTIDRLTHDADGSVQHLFIRISKNDTEFCEMKVDACFVLPLDQDKLLLNVDERRAEKFAKIPLQNYTLSFLKEHGAKVCAVLGPPWEENTTVRLLLEKEMAALFKKLDAGVFHTYQLANLVVALLFPQVRQGRLWRSILPASILQNIILFLSEYYKNSKFWSPACLHRRLIEVLLLLERCAQDEAVDMFLLPGMTALPLYTSYAYYFDAKRSRFLCKDENYTIDPFECRIHEEQVIKVFSKHAHATKFLVPYFKRMKTQNWTFLGLLGDLTLVLQSIFHCTVLPLWNETDSKLNTSENSPAESRDNSQSFSQTTTRKSSLTSGRSSATSSATSRRSRQRPTRARKEQRRPLANCCPLM